CRPGVGRHAPGLLGRDLVYILESEGKATLSAKRSILLASAAAVLAAAVVAQCAAAFAPAGATSLQTAGSVDLGPVTQTRSLVLALTPSDPSGLLAFDSEAGHPSLSAQQFAERFGPSSASVAAVEGWASAQGLQVASVSPNHLVVRITGTTSTL